MTTLCSHSVTNTTRARRRLVAALAALACTASLGAARAQQTGEFAVQRFEAAPGSDNYLSVERLRMQGNWGWSAGLVFDYARDPLVLQSCASTTDCSKPNASEGDVHVVRDMLTWSLLGSLSPTPWLQIGARLPLEYNSGDGLDPSTGGPAVGGLSKFGLGDALIEGKVRLVGGVADPATFGLAGGVEFPTGHASGSGAFIGNDSPLTGELRAIFDGASGPVSFGLNLGGVFRQDAQIGNQKIGPVDFRYGVGAGYRISPVFRVLAEGYGATQFTGENGTNTLEIDGAFEIRPLDSPLIFRIGGGTGVLQGVGVPAGRGIVSVVWSHEEKDSDGDGIPDSRDKCPFEAEDFDGFEDADGCPDPDNDKDGIPDKEDACPNVPGDKSPDPKKNGCPFTIADRDHDGVPDDVDKCPDEGGPIVIRNPKSPYYGCPDRDNDGIADKIDKCPDEPEDTDGFEDADGCPDPDNDKDGIPDERDECVNDAETYNGFQDADGCPDVAPGGGPKKLVEVDAKEIKLLESIEFEPGKATFKGLGARILDATSGAMKNYAQILELEVAVYADAAPASRKIGEARAQAIVDYLKSKGVDGARLAPKVHGPEGGPKDRVELHVVKTTKATGTLWPRPPGASAAPNAAAAAPAEPRPAPPVPAAKP